MTEKVQELLKEILSEHQDLFVVELNVSVDNNIQVVLDGDNGVPISKCVNVSRHLEKGLDPDLNDFSLSVYSAGLDMPLTMKRQYIKNIGRKLKVLTDQDQEVKGTLEEVLEDSIVLFWKQREPKPIGKGKHTVEKRHNIKFEQIKKAIVEVSF